MPVISSMDAVIAVIIRFTDGSYYRGPNLDRHALMVRQAINVKKEENTARSSHISPYSLVYTITSPPFVMLIITI
ncbi:MAG: hypothetical protein HQ553_14050 [Chloroflexi bacterium]|nr:hypothetical protein [Chloroflexota bacterium]